MPTRTRCLILTIAVLTFAGRMAAAQQPQPPAATPAALAQDVPFDPQVRAGRLPNGLHYYVRANAAPRGRAELRLVVNAGSVLEDDDQRGLAHFVEHMAFNGTEHFPGQDVAAFIQSLGMRFGAHVNAHTSFDETVYQLQIPTDEPRRDRSLAADHGRLGARRHVRSRRRSRRNAASSSRNGALAWAPTSRMRDAQLPVLLKGARYADRSPIGRPEIIRTSAPRG